MTKRTFLTGGVLLLAGAGLAHAAPAPIAVFPFDLVNTSPANSTPEELRRTAEMAPSLARQLAASGKYAPVDMAGAASILAGQPPVHQCNGCERAVARKLGARLAAYGWVQKVSNLILNVNVVIEDVDTGKQVSGGSADIRGNTDESWAHGLHYVLEESVFGQER